MNKNAYSALSLLLFFLITPSFADIEHEKCTSDLQCPSLHSCQNQICVHKGLFPITSPEIIGIVLIIIFSGLANSGGIGGGTLLSSILIVLFNYNENESIAVVYAPVFGGAIGNLINLMMRRDEKTKKPLVDYNLGLICMPPMILGTNIGVLLGRVSAPLILLVGIVAVTLYSSTKVWKKAKKQYLKETLESEVGEPALSGKFLEVNADYVYNEQQHSNNSERDIFIKQEMRLFPLEKIVLTLLLIFSVLLISTIRGSKIVKSVIGINYCSFAYWGLFLVGLFICLLFWLANRHFVKKIMGTKEKLEIQPALGEPRLTDQHIPKISIVSLVAGILAGLLGIGGGMVMGPLLLSIGMKPQNLVATSGLFVVQTSFVSFFQSALYGDVPLSVQLFLFIICLFGGLAVSLMLSWIVDKTGRSSIILFVLLFVMVLSVIVTPILDLWKNHSSLGDMLDFNSLC